MDWKLLSFTKNITVLFQKIYVVILLQIFEQQMESVFTCQCNELMVHFVWMYFLIPAFAFTAFGLSLQQGNIFKKEWFGYKRKRRCLLFWWKTLVPAISWVVILLIDGKYVACGRYKKCNSTMTTVDTKDPEMVLGKTISQIAGLSLVALFAVLYFIYLCLRLRHSPEDRYTEMYISRLEENREEFAKECIKRCLEKKAGQCEDELRREAGPPAARPGAARGADPEFDRLDVKTIVRTIKEKFVLISVRRNTGDVDCQDTVMSTLTSANTS